MKKLISIMGILALAGCAISPNSSNVYSSSQTQQVQIVRLGRIVDVRNVMIAKNGDNPPIGALAGAALGGIAAGSGIGQGRGAAAAGIAGAVIGGVLGDVAQSKYQKRPGLELTVKLDKSGEMIAVVQDADEPFRVGEQVKILSSGGVTRVTH